MKKKSQGNEIIVTIITVMVAIFVVIMTIFYNKYQDAKEDKDRYQRIVEIYKKADDNNGDTKKKYVKRLNEAEEELRKVKKETNYKGYNEKSKKERQKVDKKTRDKIYDVTGDDDLILVKNNIEFSDKVGKPEILISEDGVGTITVPTDSGYEKQTVGSIITSVLGSPYLSTDAPSIDSSGIIGSGTKRIQMKIHQRMSRLQNNRKNNRTIILQITKIKLKRSNYSSFLFAILNKR